MEKEREFEGESEQAALSEAARVLGVPVEELDYTVLDEGAEGVFGLGARPARIRVALAGGGEEFTEDSAPPAAPREVGGPSEAKGVQALEVTRKMLQLMGVTAEVQADEQEERILVSIADGEGTSEVTELFAKSRPPLAPSFQFILNKVVNRFPDDRKHIVVAAPEGARRDRNADRKRGSAGRNRDDELDPELVTLARMLGERAMATGRVITVHPMHAGDRRAVHQTLVSMEGVQTLSAGEGLYRRMHIVPKARASSPNRRRRRRRGEGEEGPATGDGE